MRGSTRHRLLALATSVILLVAACSADDARETAAPEDDARAATEESTGDATTGEALSPEVNEISRHPSDLPDSANYTLYEDDEYQNPVERSGPIEQEVHFQIQETVAEAMPGTTMDYWAFDGTVPGPMIRARGRHPRSPAAQPRGQLTAPQRGLPRGHRPWRRVGGA